MVLTLVERSKQIYDSNNVVVGDLLTKMVKQSDLLKVLPFKDYMQSRLYSTFCHEDPPSTFVYEFESFVSGWLQNICDDKYSLISRSLYLTRGEASSLNRKGSTTLEWVNSVINSVDRPTHLLTNDTTKNLLVEADVQITYDTDSFGNTIVLYRNLPILTSNNLPNELAIHCLSIGEGGVIGLQSDIEITKLDKYNQDNFSWGYGITTERLNSVARIKFITE